MNTETVRSLTVTATKPAANAPSAPQRDTASSPVPQVSTSKPAEATIHSIQETTAAVAAQLESYLESIGRSLQFSVDSASGRTVVSVRDRATGDVIRQIPSEEALRLAQALGRSGGSALLDTQV